MLKGHSNWVTAVTFSPDGQLLASASLDDTARLWEATTGVFHITLNSFHGHIQSMSFSPDGQVFHTTKGDFALCQTNGVPPLSSSQSQPCYSVVQDHWIMRNRQQFLWIPPECQILVTVVCKDMVCLGLSSGRIFLLKILYPPWLPPFFNYGHIVFLFPFLFFSWRLFTYRTCKLENYSC